MTTKWKCKLCGEIIEEYRSDHLVKEHPELGGERYFHFATVKYFDLVKEGSNPKINSKEKKKKPTLKELFKGEVLDGYLEAARVKALTEFTHCDFDFIKKELAKRLKIEVKIIPKEKPLLGVPVELLPTRWIPGYDPNTETIYTFEGDIDALLHEAGHAFADLHPLYRTYTSLPSVSRLNEEAAEERFAQLFQMYYANKLCGTPIPSPPFNEDEMNFMKDVEKVFWEA